jgi:dipeptide/tripeptide permease
MSSQQSALAMMGQYFRDFGILKQNARSYWGIQVVNFVDLTAYFAMIAVLTLFLTDNINMTEEVSGYTVGTFTALITIGLLFTGFWTDILGIRKAAMLGMTLQGIPRLGIVYCGFFPETPYAGWIVAGLLVPTAFGAAMTQTVYQVANKRFSTEMSRGASYNLWYLIMNLGGVAGGLMIDVIRKQLELDITWILSFAVFAWVISAIVIMTIVSDADGKDLSEQEHDADHRSGFERFKDLVKETAFWRFIVLMTSLLGVRAVYSYMYLLLPLYWVRVIEDVTGQKTDMGFLQALNPILIVAGLILMIPLSNKFNVFKMLVFGAMISAMSLLFLVVPWELFGDDMAKSYFIMSVCMLVMLSVGEVFWSPKLYEYTAAIAPKGQEGAYLGFSMMPWFLAKTAVGFMSGHMLVRWVPEGIGQQIQAGNLDFWDRPEAMWFILFLWAMAGPILAWIFRKWLTAGKFGGDLK